jgi:hypothetical protein
MKMGENRSMALIIAGRERKVKVIFLDFDGVLNNRERWAGSQQVDPKSPSSMIDPLCTWRLKQIVNATGARIVISSSWRNIYPLDQLAGFLWKYGIDRSAVIGKTPKIGRRGHEIRHWLKKHPVESYIILDDDQDAGSGGVDRTRFIKTDWEYGLLSSHVVDAIKLLGRKVEVH